jgi:hypothetical protein
VRVSRVQYGGVELNDRPDVGERLNRAIVDAAREEENVLNKLFNRRKGRVEINMTPWAVT